MTRICEPAILIIALALPAAAQCRNIDPARKTTYRERSSSRNIDPARKTTYRERSSMALDHTRSDVPAAKPKLSLNQQLNQLESQMARSSVTKPHTSSAVNAPLPSRAARLPSERKRPIRANYHRPKQGTALKAR